MYLLCNRCSKILSSMLTDIEFVFLSMIKFTSYYFHQF